MRQLRPVLTCLMWANIPRTLSLTFSPGESSAVNISNAVEIGICQTRAYESNWPAGFHTSLSKKVKTIAGLPSHGKRAGGPPNINLSSYRLVASGSWHLRERSYRQTASSHTNWPRTRQLCLLITETCGQQANVC